MIDYSNLHLPVARLHFFSTAITPIDLPEYTGSAFRGSFGAAFKKICCASPNRQSCNACPFINDCAYAKIFESPHHGQLSLQATNLPHPFVFEPPLFEQRQKIDAGGTFSCDMVLIGHGIDHLYHFVMVWLQMGKQGLGRGRGLFSLQTVANEDKQLIFRTETGHLLRKLKMIDFDTFLHEKAPKTVTFHITTPLRITEAGQVCRQLSFHTFFRNLLRRASLLAQLYAKQTWNLDYQSILLYAHQIKIIAQKLQWYDWHRYSNRQQQRMPLGGLIGSFTVTGDLQPFWPLLRLGTYLHIGKNTSFGMGKYNIIC